MTALESSRRAWLLLGATPLVPILFALPGGGWVLPLVAPLILWPTFAPAVREARYGRAVCAALVWAALLSAGVVAVSQVAPTLAGTRIVNGEPYRIEMFRWIETGVGRENVPADFVPQHLLHLGAFALLSWASAGYLGLTLGAALVAYMSYFVGSFALASGAPFLGAVVAWVPWSVVRVVAFVILGSVLARPLRLRRRGAFDRRDLRWIAAALAGIALDLLMKATMAPGYGRFLRRFLAG